MLYFDSLILKHMKKLKLWKVWYISWETLMFAEKSMLWNNTSFQPNFTLFFFKSLVAEWLCCHKARIFFKNESVSQELFPPELLCSFLWADHRPVEKRALHLETWLFGFHLPAVMECLAAKFLNVWKCCSWEQESSDHALPYSTRNSKGWQSE